MRTVIIAACQKKVTLFIGTKKFEASWIEVHRGPHARYVDAIHFSFKPKGARNLRVYVEGDRPRTVFVEGWEHPEFDWLIRSIDAAPEVELTPGVSSYRMVSASFYPGMPVEKNNRYELEFEDYVAQLPASRLLLDTRGMVLRQSL